MIEARKTRERLQYFPRMEADGKGIPPRLGGLCLGSLAGLWEKISQTVALFLGRSAVYDFSYCIYGVMAELCHDFLH